ncbi:MAG: PQQ-binding-like beta-propeller repeat protein [Planctomycetia bacterium]|nr:PQQ-binding-like beta-propeller repeat protein [Planctomycetia bacterium]
MRNQTARVLRYYAAVLVIPALLAGLANRASAEDWPTWRKDRLRTAVTTEQLSLPLAPVWSYRTRAAQIAPRPTDNPMYTNYPDCARFNVPLIAAGDAVYFSSAAEGRVVCLDAASGKLRWEFMAGGGVNRTPMYWKGRIYFGSDDGHAYCLDAASGKVAWSKQVVPANRCLIAYGKMISAWPVMTDVMVADDVAYFSAGAFPHDGAFLEAVDAQTGKSIWSSGRAGENAWRESLAPGGHLYVTQNHVWVPKDFRGYSGIAYGSGVPFRRSDGKFVGGWGGADPEMPNTKGTFFPLLGAVKDGVRYCGNVAWNTQDEDKKRVEVWKQEIPGRWVDADSAIAVRTGGKHGLPVITRYDPDLCTTICAGDLTFNTAFDGDPKKGVGSGVYARDPKTGAVRWSAEVPERANQLVVANGHLLVSTRSGTIYCYASAGAGAPATPNKIEEPIDPNALKVRPEVAKAAEKIIAQTGVKDGYALVLDSADGQLAFELARKTNLYICAVFRDAEAMHTARLAYQRAGLHLSRIVTWLQAPDTKLPYPTYFADLIVSEGALDGKTLPSDTEELARLCKPIRGIAFIGGAAGRESLQKWADGTKLSGWEIVDSGGLWAKRVRPPLKDGGGWTHMYGDPGQTGCSEDGELKPPLGVVWFGPPFVQYGTDQTPLIINGILVNPDANSLEGYDEYTGRKLWRLDAGGIGIGEGKIAASSQFIYVRHANILAQIDLFTGKELGLFRSPFGEKFNWGWFAVDPDGKRVYGGSDGGFYCVEAKAGNATLLWKIGGPDSQEKYGGMTVMSDGRIYVLRGKASDQQRAECLADLKKWFQTQPADLRDEFEKQMKDRDVRELTAIDCATGKVLWSRGVDITNCGGAWLRPVTTGGKRGYAPHISGDMFAHSGVVVFGSSGGADKGWTVWNSGGYQSRGLAGYDGATGKPLWIRYANYRARPVIVDDTVYAEPWAYDIHTGARRTREHPITGEQADWAWCRYDKQCGIFSASKYFLFGRSMGLGYQDLLSDQGLYTFWHSRSSCWMDCSSGGGMMIKPPQSLGCVCQWNMPFTIGMGQVSTQPTAAPVFAQPGPTLPVKHLHLDFGSTGDRRDSAGNLWIRPDGPAGALLLLGYNVKPVLYTGGEPVQRSAVYTKVQGAEPPFVFATCLLGLKQCTMPINTPQAAAATYKVRLGFSALPGDKPGQRVFSVKLNGQTVLENFDIVVAAGGADRALWKEFTVQVKDNLSLELVASGDTPTREQMPLLNAAEVLRKD